MKTFALAVFGVVLGQLVLACGGAPIDNDDIAVTKDCRFADNAMPNPAADYCLKSGHTLRDEACRFSDGTECAQWAFFRGECGLDHTFCAQQGFIPRAGSGEVTCELGDGTSCDDWSYSRGCRGASE